MKISGFTIIKNAVENDYPVKEAILSILPLVDEMIVLVGDCTDDTLHLINSIGNDKIKVHHSIWDANLTHGGSVLAAETNKALSLIAKDSTWAFYIQADEVVPEWHHETIAAACKKYEKDEKVEGLLFDYLHFYGNYKYVADHRRWYKYEVRIIRSNRNISSYKDAQGFRVGNRKILVQPINACIFHYGWVKTPKQMMKKLNISSQFWVENAANQTNQQFNEAFDFTDYQSITLYNGKHPEVMRERISAHHLDLELDVAKKNMSFIDYILYQIEKLTGKRLFSFKNYKVIR
jgi:hypothetical protein